MKKFILVPILFCLSASICFAQKRGAIIKPTKPPIKTAPVAEISAADWKILTDALQSENWEKSATLAAQYSKKLEADNDKKQLAQLRYLSLYALAGKILALSSANKTAEEEAAWKTLDEAVGGFIGKEFVLPPHQSLADCKKSVNYICAVQSDDRALRITDTNKAGTSIHSFDYILFDKEISVGDSAENKIFLGGNLKRAEFNQDLSKRWVMRLIFERGFVSLVAR